jgi:dTDP-4-amino-4,6-dideoxygalactose transaminase
MITCANPRAQYLSHKSEIDKAIHDVLDGSAYILGNQVELLEKNFANYIGTDFCIGVANGTDAIEIALRSLDIGYGDKVITVSHSAVATVAGIEASGAKPVIVDLEEDYFTIDPNLLENALSNSVKAVIAVHIYGQASSMKEIKKFCKTNNLFLIEDCAQAHGAYFNNQRLGSIGDIGCYSCYPTKNLGAIGDGGLITTNSKLLATKIRQIREYGWVDRVSQIKGRNSRLDELQAAILNVKLNYLDSDNKKRRELAEVYDQLSSNDFKIPKRRKNCDHVFHLYVCSTSNRDDLIKYLEDFEIYPGIHYPLPIHLHPAYLKNIELASEMTVTESIAKNIISLPMYPELPIEDAQKIVDLISKFYQSNV